MLASEMRLLGVPLALLCLVTACGSAIHHSAVSTSAVGPECGSAVSGPDFHVSACMSGGARAGHAHPKELLVVRNDGSSVAYPADGGFGFAVGDGEVVATYDDELVQVTSRRLVPLVTEADLAGALHRQTKTILIMGFGHLSVDARGDIYFFVSTLIHGRHGCQSRYLERLTGGTIRQIRASSTPPNDICY